MEVVIVQYTDGGSYITLLVKYYLDALGIDSVIHRKWGNSDADLGGKFLIYTTSKGWCYGEAPSSNAFFHIPEERAEDICGDITRYNKVAGKSSSKEEILKFLRSEMSQIIGGSHLAGILDDLLNYQE